MAFLRSLKPNNEETCVEVKMLKTLVQLGLGLLVGGSSNLQGAILDFDAPGLVHNTQLVNYGGFNWGSNWQIVSDAVYTGSTWRNDYGSPSGENAIFNRSGVFQVTVSNTTDFRLDGASFTTWADENEFQSGGYSSSSVTVQGWKDGLLVDSASMPLSPEQYNWLATDFRGSTKSAFLAAGQRDGG